MRACLRWQLRVLGCAWWLLLLLPVLALLLGWEAAAVPAAYLRRGAELDPRSALALVLDMRHLFPLAGAVWASLFIGMDYAAEAQSLALSRGYRRGQVIRSKVLLYLLGCAFVSVTEQVIAVLAAVPELSALPAAFLLRCFCLRLVLDMGSGSLKAMAPHSSTLAWKIPWTEEPGGLQSMGSLRVRHD